MARHISRAIRKVKNIFNRSSSSSQEPPHEQPQEGFMKLNYDCRRLIYDLLLKSETPMVKPECTGITKTGNMRSGHTYTITWSTSEKTGISATICRTSRMIAAETLPILYGGNTFDFHRNSEMYLFVNAIGSNKQLINRARIPYEISHRHTDDGCPGEDKILDEVWVIAKRCTRDYGSTFTCRFPNIKHLSVFWEWSGNGKCPAFWTALTATDSDFVVALLKAKLSSLLTLEIDDFPPELVRYILKFLQSGQKYKPPPAGPKVESPPLAPVKPTRPLPPHACLSCQNCKCAHGVKPNQLLEIQKSLRAIQSQLSGGATKLDQASMKVLERFAGVFL